MTPVPSARWVFRAVCCGLASKIQILARQALKTGRKSGKGNPSKKRNAAVFPSLLLNTSYSTEPISPRPGNCFLHLQMTIIFHLAALCRACGCSLMFPASTAPRPAEDPLEFVAVTSIAHSPVFLHRQHLLRGWRPSSSYHVEPFYPCFLSSDIAGDMQARLAAVPRARRALLRKSIGLWERGTALRLAHRVPAWASPTQRRGDSKARRSFSLSFHLPFQRMRSVRDRLQRRDRDSVQRRTPVTSNLLLWKSRMQRCKALGSFCFHGGVRWHRSSCSGGHVARGMGQALATGRCASICPSTATSTPTALVPSVPLVPVDRHKATSACAASNMPQALGSLRDEEFLRRGTVLLVSCETPDRWLWRAANSRYKQDNPKQDICPRLSSPLLQCLGYTRVPADIVL